MTALTFCLVLSLPLILFVGALSARRRPRLAVVLAASAVPLALALIVARVTHGPATSPLIGVAGLGLSFRIDALSVTMASLIALLGAVITSFSATYLEGEAQRGRFLAWLMATLCAVQMLVLAGNLYQFVIAWIAMGQGVHRLLLHYAERPASRRAARRKFVIARTGDVLMLFCVSLMLTEFGTADIATVLASAGDGVGPAGQAAVWFLVFAAMLKSAMFPLHPWLVTVVETPTPVSALLHAGVVNAGGLALLRFADLAVQVPSAMLTVAFVGGLTALVGSAIMLTQTSVKLRLAYSTIAQMGFMMLQCGLGAFAAAAVHLVGHSLYKAHTFLNSGARGARRVEWPAAGNAKGLVPRFASLLALLVLYTAVGALTGHSLSATPVVFALGAVFMTGLWLLAFDLPRATAPRGRVLLLGGVSAGVFFAVHAASAALLAGALPAPLAMTPAAVVALALTVATAAVLALAQAALPATASPAAQSLRRHLSRGLYLEDLFDRCVGTHRLGAI